MMAVVLANAAKNKKNNTVGPNACLSFIWGERQENCHSKASVGAKARYTERRIKSRKYRPTFYVNICVDSPGLF